MTVSTCAERLRAELVTALQETGSIRSPEVAAAFGKVPRETFAPGVPLEAVYSARDVIVTRRDASGRAVSSVSAPWIQAEMIEAAQLARGSKVLEIGSGGYNAALLAEITGPEGSVVTVDIDPWVAERAGRFLAHAGYPGVQVIAGDAEHAAGDRGPFDAILVTAGAWDCPWAPMLAERGRMVVPLMFATYTRSITFLAFSDPRPLHRASELRFYVADMSVMSTGRFAGPSGLGAPAGGHHRGAAAPGICCDMRTPGPVLPSAG